ncbi:MAG: iron-containing alcohol dehydrogenase [Spirochaetaceae bacterium]|nr:MAG: iron-containing alcohol dehydrogenase [Spirochaetaceae bacterium]
MDKLGVFTIARQPRLLFGAGSIADLPDVVAEFAARRVLIVTGSGSVRRTSAWNDLVTAFSASDLDLHEYSGDGEPTATQVDEAAEHARKHAVDLVVAIGGGSVVDLGKAVGAAARMPDSVERYLEGVGDREPSGDTLPVIAVPTTAGTGAEATKNAVISRLGPDGYKKSLRHDAFVPCVAIIDPYLHVGCPRDVSAASGLDAITQLIEAYVSTKATPFTDALALSGLSYASASFRRVLATPGDVDARAGMAYAAYLSGVCLANAGLGLVHGAAAPIGAVRAIPHGVVCGNLLPVTVAATVEAAHRENNTSVIARYAACARALAAESVADESHRDDRSASRALIDLLSEFDEIAGLPRFGAYGFTADDGERVVRETSGKNHPVAFTADEIASIIGSRV